LSPFEIREKEDEEEEKKKKKNKNKNKKRDKWRVGIEGRKKAQAGVTSGGKGIITVSLIH